MMTRYILAGAAILLGSTASFAFKGDELASDARVDIGSARAIALAAHPGTISDEELEREDGGSGLRYTFDIRSPGGDQEVGVDAISGKVLENAPGG